MSKIEEKLIDVIKTSLKNKIQDVDKSVYSNIYLENPKDKKFGDYSTNIAMRLTKIIKKPPFQIASLLIEEINIFIKKARLEALIEKVELAKPGFINFYITKDAAKEELLEIISKKDKYGRLDFGKGEKIQIEFVSANPTGPLTIAHGRQAAVGDSLAKILEHCDYKVVREYYINDEGVQMNTLAKSIRARFENSTFPENGYKGHYITETASNLRLKVGDRNDLTDEDFFKFAYDELMSSIKKDLEDFGVEFDVWYSQKKLMSSGKVEKALKALEEKGHIYKQDGATWFRSTSLGDDKDRVVIKSDGTYTYLAPDIAYHRDKFEKGYSKVINIWGPDHHGYVNRIKAACEALGFNKENLSILICQLVTLFRDKKPVRMSTREGEFITLREVIDEVGKDAGRFFFIMRKTDSHLDFDLELAKSKSMDNPVYYIQYAHARISSVLSFSGNKKPDLKSLSSLNEEGEIDLIKKLMQYPKAIESSARNLEPYTLLSYLQELSSLFHSYYDSHRIVTEDTSLTSARITLVTALKSVILSGLCLLGVSVPEKM
ncbi:MAG: arginine--tRNA ligase [Candidatus Omnitrophota bacterium]